MLAIIDDLAILRHRIRRRAPSQKRTRFEHFDLEPRAPQRGRCRQPREPSARNQHFRHSLLRTRYAPHSQPAAGRTAKPPFSPPPQIGRSDVQPNPSPAPPNRVATINPHRTLTNSNPPRKSPRLRGEPSTPGNTPHPIRRTIKELVPNNPVNRPPSDRVIPRPGLLINRARPLAPFRRLHQLPIQRLQKLAAPHRAEKRLQPPHRGLVPRPYRHHQPLVQNLGIARIRQPELPIEPRHIRLRLRSQEMQPLLRAPPTRRPSRLHPGKHIGIWLRRPFRNSRTVNPLLERDTHRQLIP